MFFKQPFEQFESKILLFHLGYLFQEILIKEWKFRAFCIENFHNSLCLDCNFQQLCDAFVYNFTGNFIVSRKAQEQCPYSFKICFFKTFCRGEQTAAKRSSLWQAFAFFHKDFSRLGRNGIHKNNVTISSVWVVGSDETRLSLSSNTFTPPLMRLARCRLEQSEKRNNRNRSYIPGNAWVRRRTVDRRLSWCSGRRSFSCHVLYSRAWPFESLGNADVVHY